MTSTEKVTLTRTCGPRRPQTPEDFYVIFLKVTLTLIPIKCAKFPGTYTRHGESSHFPFFSAPIFES